MPPWCFESWSFLHPHANVQVLHPPVFTHAPVRKNPFVAPPSHRWNAAVPQLRPSLPAIGGVLVKTTNGPQAEGGSDFFACESLRGVCRLWPAIWGGAVKRLCP